MTKRRRANLVAKKKSVQLFEQQQAERRKVEWLQDSPNEHWYGILLDTAKDQHPKQDPDDRQKWVDALLTAAGATVLKGDYPGGTRVQGYTHDVHQSVSNLILNTLAPWQRIQVPPAEPVNLGTEEEQTAAEEEMGRAYENVGAPGDDEESTGDDDGTCFACGVEPCACDGGIFCRDCGLPPELCGCPSHPGEAQEEDPKSADAATEPDAGTVSESSSETTGKDCEHPGAGLHEDGDVVLCPDCGATVTDVSEPRHANAKCVCGSMLTDATSEELADWEEWHAECEAPQESDIKERPHDPEILDHECTEEHEEGIPCLACSWTGGSPKQQQYSMEEIWAARLARLDESTGEIMPVEDCFEVAQVKQPAPQFAIVDDGSYRFMIGVIRGLQMKVAEACDQLAMMIGRCLGALSGLEYKYGLQLAKYTEKKLTVVQSGKKAGQYHKKSHRELEGAVFFTKTGGAKVFDYGRLKQFAQELPNCSHCRGTGLANPEQAEYYKIKIERKPSKTRACELAEQNVPMPGTVVEPSHELGNLAIGGKTRWSWNAEKTRLSKKIKEMQLNTLSEIGAPEEDPGE
jgi:hypothetical protein